MSDHPQAPWFFHRDELTLLEEGVDDLFQSHEKTSSVAVKTMEEFVLKEHLDSEETFEQDLADQIGPEWVVGDIDDHTCIESDEFQLKNAMMSSPPAPVDPLYRESLSWSRNLVQWARKEYLREGNQDRDIYRVLVNAHLVPIKICFSSAEDASEDSLAAQIVQKELELAMIYLKRIDISMKALDLKGKLPDTMKRTQSSTQRLLKEIDIRLQRLNNLGKFNGV